MFKCAICMVLAYFSFHALADEFPVNPFIGTAKGQAVVAIPGGLSGATHPGAVAPFGMVTWGPDTIHPETSGYNYADTQIRDFSLTHMSGPGCGNSAELPLLPFVGSAPQWQPLSFTHANEAAGAGYYRVTLDNGVRVELTASARTGLGRFTFPVMSGDVGLLLNTTYNGSGASTGTVHFRDARHAEATVNGGNFCGTNNKYKLYVALEWDHDAHTEFTNGVAKLTFAAASAHQVQLKVGLSYVSQANAWLNMRAENTDWSWENLAARTASDWRTELAHIRIQTADNARRTVFYTALYHSLLHPNIESDVNGEYLGFDQKVHVATQGHYANFSGWDIYRSQVQLLAAFYPEQASAIAQSFVDDGTQCGALPRWSQNNAETGVMVGDPGAIIAASFHAFGLNFDARQGLALALKSALDPSAACNGIRARPGLAEYIQRGYLTSASNTWGPAASTIEYATADYAVADFASTMGDATSATTLRSRAGSWRNLWNPAARAILPRDTQGNFAPTFDLASDVGFVEGDSAQYTLAIPFDMGGVVAAMGDGVLARLDDFFTNVNAGPSSAHLYIGNEPGFTAPWAYLWARQPARTQEVVRRILLTQFLNEAGGLPGNDDLGATSSWYVWSAIGLYPAIPGVGGLVVGSPLFDHIDAQVGPEHNLEISAQGAEGTPYVKDLQLNGQARTSSWIVWRDLASGGRLDFNMTSAPSAWGTGAADVPPSLSQH